MAVGGAFNLRVAKALIDEVGETSDKVLDEARQVLREGEDEGFFNRIKSSFASGKMVDALHDDIDKAIELCDALSDDVTIPHPEVPELRVNAMSVKAEAFFHKGLVTWGQGDPQGAVELMNDSLALMPDQATYLNIGLCFNQMRETRGGSGLAGKIQRAVTSGAGQAEAAIDSFRRCVELDSESEVGVKAGMELARLGQL